MTSQGILIEDSFVVERKTFLKTCQSGISLQFILYVLFCLLNQTYESKLQELQRQVSTAAQ
jgi:hypothetical protein